MEHSKILDNSDINVGEESKSVLEEKVGKVEDAIISGKKEIMNNDKEKDDNDDKKELLNDSIDAQVDGSEEILSLEVLEKGGKHEESMDCVSPSSSHAIDFSFKTETYKDINDGYLSPSIVSSHKVETTTQNSETKTKFSDVSIQGANTSSECTDSIPSFMDSSSSMPSALQLSKSCNQTSFDRVIKSTVNSSSSITPS